MNCVILAAGLGSRMRGVSDSKPLSPVGGVPLIEHVVRRAAAGGADAFVVATGHEADRVEAFLTGLAERTGLPIDFARVADWTLPNGHSVLAAADRIEGDYLLLMADHLFDPAIVRGLLEDERDGAALVLAVDRNIAGPLIDIEDATKVALAADGGIAGIGKQLERYDAIDTGVFRATPALADAIRQAVAAGGAGSLSEGVQRLAAAGQALTMDVGAARWIDVDDPRMLALAERLVADEALRDIAA